MTSPASDPPSTLERLREAAFELFAEKGYEGASMSDLAERVGVAKPSLYNYYRSKEDLLLDLLGESVRRWSGYCMAPFAREASFERQLADHLAAVVRFAQEHPHLVAVFQLATTHVQGELGRRVEALVAEVEGDLRARIGVRLEAALAAGELALDSAVDAQIFLGVFFHGLLFLQANCHHDAGPIDARIEQLWRQLYRGLSGREPRERIAR